MLALQLLHTLIDIGGVVFWLLSIALLVAWCQIRPWDASNRDHSVKVAGLPYTVFAFGCYSRFFGSWLVNNVPAPMLAIDIASMFLKSQVLFAVVNLGIPDELCAGPQTASQLAAACGCTHVEQLDRVLKAAAVLGIVSRRRRKTCRTEGTAVAPLRPGAHADACSEDEQRQTRASTAGTAAATADLFTADTDEYEYYSNHLTACLCKHHKSSMAAMVKLYEYNFKSATSLTKSLLSTGGITSHELETGQKFWDNLTSDVQKGAVFDEAMHSFKDLGGASVLTGYNWRKYSAVIDIAGGNGSFVAALLAAHPQLTGTVMDQQQQVERGLGWWKSHHPDLLPRVTFKPGDMFDGDAIPSAPTSHHPVAYVLRNILHNWPDKDALKILHLMSPRTGLHVSSW